MAVTAPAETGITKISLSCGHVDTFPTGMWPSVAPGDVSSCHRCGGRNLSTVSNRTIKKVVRL